MNVYLDIDGVLIENGGSIAQHADDFLRYVLLSYPDSTYWLTTRCQGDASSLLDQIGQLFTPNTQEVMKLIKPTQWPIVKTQAIDFTKPFLWFDDQLGFADKQALIEHGALENLILVNLNKKPNQLSEFVNAFPTPLAPRA